VDRWGENGNLGTLQALPMNRFIRSHPEAAFVTNPVVLDAAGQLLAYWYVEEHPEMGFNTMPYAVEALYIYAPHVNPGEQLHCQVRVQECTNDYITADIHVIAPNGNPCMSLVGWSDQPIALPEEFYRARYHPSDSWLSMLWPDAQVRFPGAIECRRMDDYPNQLLHKQGRVWFKVLAYLALSRRERDTWDSSGTVESLLARIAGKDVVRSYLQRQDGLVLCLADIEIDETEAGSYEVRGSWTGTVDKIPTLYLIEAPGSGAALLTDGDDVPDMESLRSSLSPDNSRI